MTILPVSGGNMYRPNSGRAVRKNNPTQPKKQKIDKLESAVRDNIDRKQLLEGVKKRIQSGYYQSNEVMDDLSDSFAKAFDQRV